MRRFAAVHINIIAQTIARIDDYNAAAARVAYLEFAEVLRKENEDFDRDRFRAACNQDKHYEQ